ncbi:hypothetical protein [Paenibacillus sp. JCM 10914]
MPYTCSRISSPSPGRHEFVAGFDDQADGGVEQGSSQIIACHYIPVLRVEEQVGYNHCSQSFAASACCPLQRRGTSFQDAVLEMNLATAQGGQGAVGILDKTSSISGSCSVPFMYPAFLQKVVSKSFL